MKTWIGFLISLFSIMAFQAGAQEFIGSNVRFSKEAEHSLCIESSTTLSCDDLGESRTVNEIGLIRLNSQNNEFSFDISLFPILTSPKSSDSITDMNRAVRLNFRGQFPVTDLDFLVNDGTEKTFSLPGELTINNRTYPVNMMMAMHSSMERKDEARGIESYPVLISFLIEINPAEYGLDFETINFVRTIYVEVRNGIINKSNNSP